MIFCPNECIGAGSGKGEGWPDRCATRSTHAGSRFPPFGNRFKTFRRESSPVSATSYLRGFYLNVMPISSKSDIILSEKLNT